MKAMPLPFEEFQGKGVFEFSSFSSSSSSSDSLPLLLLHQPPQKWTCHEEICYVGSEPTSVLDATGSPSPPTSSSSTMASHGGNSATGNGGDGSCSTNSITTGATATVSENPSQAALDAASNVEKCGLRMEDWEGVLSESPGQDQSILRLIMGDIEDPSAGLSNLLHSNVGTQMVDFNGGFGVLDQGFESIVSNTNIAEPSFPVSVGNTVMFSSSSSSSLVFNPQQQVISMVDEKLNRNQVHFSENPSFFMPLTYPMLQDQQVFSQPQAKSLLCDTIGQNYDHVPKSSPLLDSGQELLFTRRQPMQLQPWHSFLEPPPAKQPKVSSTADDFAVHQLQQTIIDHIFKAAELIEAGNPVHAQGILARLNHHQLSPIGKPFHRAAFYMKEALQLLLHSNNNAQTLLAFSPISFVFKIGAYKAFSEISPVLQFANFTCNQALIEAVEKFDHIHIIDFDVGFGVQWASFMQELVLRNNGAPSLKVTAVVVSPSTCDEVELSFTRESLKQYAKEINMSFELDVMTIESLTSASFLDTEAIVVNLPVSCFSNHPSSLPLALGFIKQLMPKIVVTLDRNCDQSDVPFPHKLIHALQSYTALLESLDAVNVNLDVLQKIERHFVQPAIEKIILGRRHSKEKLPPWKNLFLSSGFSPFTFSNSTEAQAECLVQRAPVRGFQVERKQSSLTLCWQQKELISVSTWRC